MKKRQSTAKGKINIRSHEITNAKWQKHETLTIRVRNADLRGCNWKLKLNWNSVPTSTESTLDSRLSTLNSQLSSHISNYNSNNSLVARRSGRSGKFELANARRKQKLKAIAIRPVRRVVGGGVVAEFWFWFTRQHCALSF